MPSSESPLDPFASDITRYYNEGLGPKAIAEELVNYGVNTTEASVRRAIKRYGLSRSYADVQDEFYYDEVPWGTGRAQLVEPSTKEDTEVVVSGSDFHYPYHNAQLVDDFIEMVYLIQPHRVVLNGDINDFFQLSSFNIRKERLDDLQWEIDGGNEIRRRIREAAPNAVLDETLGNHDDRIRSYIAVNARAISTLRALDPENLFRYKEYEINFHPSAGFLLRPEFLIKHGTLVRGEAGATAKAEMNQAGICGFSGHVHRLQTYRKSGYVQRQWTEQGSLCRQDPDYVKGTHNWQAGCVIGEFSTKSKLFNITEVPEFGGRLHMPFFLRQRNQNVAA